MVYEKANKETIERIQKYTKESEDERIKKAIKKALQVRCDGSRIISDEPVTLEEALAWLEKQGEQKSMKTCAEYYNKDRELKMPVLSEFQDKLADILMHREYDGPDETEDDIAKGRLEYELAAIRLSEELLPLAQKEQKPADTEKGTNGNEREIPNSEQKPADKVEPKFHEGEWIVWQDKCYKVNYNGCGYELIDQNDLSTSLEYGTVDENARLWDITKDAKDGDALFLDLMDGYTFIYNGVNPDMAILYSFIISNDSKSFIIRNNDGKEYLPYHIGKPNTGIGYIEENKNIIHPATKEQRDLLFQKLKEAGYEWDEEFKEIRKIPTPANVKDIIGRLKSLKDRVQPQTTWKPSDEQMDALANACDGKILSLDYLNSLYQDLKKLREE